MGGIAKAALYPAYGKGNLPHGCLYITGIAPMPHKTAAVSAGAFQLAGLDGIHGGIIKLL